MKKAKVILTAIGIMVVVGSEVAFKAHHKGFGTIYCNDNSMPLKHCNVNVNFVPTTGIGITDPCGTGDGKFGTVVNNSTPCPLQISLKVTETAE